MKLCRKICSLVLAFSFIYIQCVYADVNIFVNGKPQVMTGFLQNDTTYVPLRMVSEAMGAKVTWDDATKSAYVSFDEDELVSSLVDRLSPSVVAIVGKYKPEYMSNTQNSYNSFTAHGTGVVIKSGGVILTNAHVVEEIENITVIFSDGSSYPGIVQYSDKLSDLAVVKIDKIGLLPVTMETNDNTRSGKSVIAIGTPLSLSMRNTVTKGIISGVDVSVSGAFYPLLQTDAAINAGNSGGPLINMQGKLVGINSSKYSGVGIEGMAFAIPVDTINYVLNQFEMYGKVLRPDLGVTFENSWEAQLGIPTHKGITVVGDGNSVLKNGDVVLAVEDAPVHSVVEFNRAVRDYYKGADTLRISYERNHTLYTSDIKVELK